MDKNESNREPDSAAGQLTAQQMMQALREREERMQAVLNTAADAIITIDRRGIMEGVNPATARMFGFTQQELVGKNVAMLMPSPYCEEHDGYIARYLETGVAHIIGIGREVVGKRKDGSTFPLDLAVSQIDHLGLFTGILRDITERVESRKQLLQSERLAAIGEAMAGLAHESRNALQRSQACLDLLIDQLADRPESLELLASIQLAQDELHRLYEEVRAYSAPVQVRPQWCDLREVLHKAWDDMATVRAGRTTTMREKTQCDDLACHVDPFVLGQVFRNILDNALHACGDPVEIQVEYAAARLAVSPAISIAIRDNGPGVPPEHAQQIFNSFFTTKAQGTGLGMAIAQRLVEAHQGKITLNTECQQGAEFVVTLPRSLS